MQLLSIEDPRDNLQKATRWELIEFAKANGIQVAEDSPAIVTAKLLRERGLTNIKIPDRPLGLYTGKGDSLVEPPAVQGNLATNADDLLVQQYEQQKQEEADISKMSVNELRAACKARGIKLSRRDNIVTLREKLGQ